MSHRLPVPIGEIFGRLTVKAPAIHGSNGLSKWICVCACGKENTYFASNLRRGGTTSCGCQHDEDLGNRSRTHGKRKTTEYNIWLGLRARCENPNSPAYASYGGRGISVSERWSSSFENFYEDMGPRPSSGHSVDRINNDGPYAPDNCRWATELEQKRNTTRNVVAIINGERLIAADAARALGLDPGTISARLKRGWTLDRAFTEPSRNPSASAKKARRAEDQFQQAAE